MDVYTAEGYWQSITVLQAEETMLKFKIQDFPHLKPQDRSKIHNQFEKMATTSKKSNKKKISNKDLADILSRR